MAFRGPPRAIWLACSIRAKAAPSLLSAPPGLLLEAARSGNDEILEMPQGDLQKCTKNTRAELKRELARLGRYKGPLGDTWDGRANMAIGRYLGQRADPAVASCGVSGRIPDFT